MRKTPSVATGRSEPKLRPTATEPANATSTLVRPLEDFRTARPRHAGAKKTVSAVLLQSDEHGHALNVPPPNAASMCELTRLRQTRNTTEPTGKSTCPLK